MTDDVPPETGAQRADLFNTSQPRYATHGIATFPKFVVRGVEAASATPRLSLHRCPRS